MSWRRVAECAATASACWLLACVPADTDRVAFLAQTLEQRAKHLASDERDKIARGLMQAERQAEVDAFLLLAMIEEESHFRPRARSRRGALGLLQVLPSTGRDVCKRHRIPWRGDASLFEPSLNLRIGAIYLAELREQFGSWDLALTAYNRGPTRTRRALPSSTQPSSRYAARVLQRFESFHQAAGTTAGRGRAAS